MQGDKFINTSDHLEVWAVHDGVTVDSDGDPLNVQPVLRVRGRYRDFAMLETPTLGILTRASRVATNVYETLVAARGKPVLFFPARFDVHEVQAADGYAYNIAVQRFNMDYAGTLGPFVSTDAQGDWWGGAGGGTVAHAAIASFLGDTCRGHAGLRARCCPVSIPRIALVDFNNDCVGNSLLVCQAHVRPLPRAGATPGKPEEAERYRLYGVRLDTGGNLRDVSVPAAGRPRPGSGRQPAPGLPGAPGAGSAPGKTGTCPPAGASAPASYCREVKIVVSGGFTPEKIRRFEKLSVPVDIYAVGSALFDNHGATVTDYTADVVRVKVHGEWVDMAKIGRRPCDNPDLERVLVEKSPKIKTLAGAKHPPMS